MSTSWSSAEERVDAAADKLIDASERAEDKLNAAIESLDPRFDAAEDKLGDFLDKRGRTIGIVFAVGFVIALVVSFWS